MTLTDKEKEIILNKLIVYLYNDGVHLKVRLSEIFKELKLEITEMQCYALVNKIRLDDLMKMDVLMIIGENTHEVGYLYTVSLSDKSKVFLDKYKTYTAYLKAIRKKENSTHLNEKFERILKYVTGIIAVVATISTLILSIMSSTDKQERSSLEQDKQQLIKERDSLIRAISNQQKPAGIQPIKDSVR